MEPDDIFIYPNKNKEQNNRKKRLLVLCKRGDVRYIGEYVFDDIVFDVYKVVKKCTLEKDVLFLNTEKKTGKDHKWLLEKDKLVRVQRS